MSDMYLTNFFYEEFSEKSYKKPRARFIRYYDDLHKRAGDADVSPASFNLGAQLTTVDLAQGVLQRCDEAGLLQTAELIIFAYWSHEFDAELTAGSYFTKQFNLPGKTFDILDQGLLAPVTGLQLIKSFMQSKNLQQAILICADQTTIPVPKNFTKPKPTKSSAIALHFSARATPSALLAVTNVSIKQHNPSQRITDQPANCAELWLPLLHKNISSHFNYLIQDPESDQQAHITGKYL